MYILAIDPGLTTGIALIDETGDLQECKTMSTVTDVIIYIDDFWESPEPLRMVIVEDFVGAGPRTKEAIFVLKLIGAIVATCILNGTKYIEQAPQVRLPLHPDAQRRAPIGTSKHVIDAYAHALAYLESVHEQVDHK